MGQASGLIHKRHRRGKKRRDKLRLALRVGLYAVLIGFAAGLSAGIVHVVERPVAPFEGLPGPPPPPASGLEGPFARQSEPASEPQALASRAELATLSAGSVQQRGAAIR